MLPLPYLVGPSNADRRLQNETQHLPYMTFKQRLRETTLGKYVHDLEEKMRK